MGKTGECLSNFGKKVKVSNHSVYVMHKQAKKKPCDLAKHGLQQKGQPVSRQLGKT